MIVPSDFVQLCIRASFLLLMNMDEKNPWSPSLLANAEAWHQMPMTRFALMNREFRSETTSRSP